MELYFFDTYAFFETMEGNPKYSRFAQEKIVTSIINLAELSFNIRRDSNAEEVERTVKKYTPLLTEIKTEDVIKATELKFNNRKLSLADSIGYSISQRIGAKFVTGDKEFRHMKNVEFLK